jgi:hypothetical protein
MPAKKLRGHRRMGAETMKITVVGVLLIIATIIAALIIIGSLNESRGDGLDKN